MNRLMPRQPVPPLEVPTVNGGLWSATHQRPENFTMLVAYRGLHCSICKPYLRDLSRRLPDFHGRGVNVIALSCDTEFRARSAKSDWGLGNLTIGYQLSVDTARDWGLYLSSGITEGEPEQFCEPGVFLVMPDTTLYWASISSMPFARPAFQEIIQALDFVIPNRYPARGELT